MRLLIISDSHGNKAGINKIFEDESFDYMFFLGDGLSDLGTYVNLENVFAVSGNCDFFSKVVNEKTVDIDGCRIFFTHGNKYGVKSTLAHLIEKGKEVGANIVLYGHTHRKSIENVDGIYFINPGKFYPNYEGESCGVEILLDDNGVRIGDLIIK